MSKFRFLFIIVSVQLLLFFNLPFKSNGQDFVVYSKNDVKKVLDEIRLSIEEVHPNPYHSISKKEIDSLYRLSVLNLPDSLTEVELYKLLLPLVNSYNDGHIQLTCPFGKFINNGINENKGIFPFTLYQIDDGIFIKISVFDEIVKPGYQLISIDNIGIDNIINDYSKFKFGDNLTIRKRKAVEDFMALDFLVNSGKESYLIGYKKTANDSTHFCTVNAAKMDDIIKFNSSFSPPQSIDYFLKSTIKLQNLVYLQLHPSMKVALLTLPSFDVSADLEKEYNQKIDSIFEYLKVAKIDTLLIDIRGNGGGQDFPSQFILNYIASKDYCWGKAYFKRSSHQKRLYENMLKDKLSDSSYIRSSEYYNYFTANDGEIIELDSSVEKSKDEEFLYKGKVFVLISKDTYSAAITFAAICQCFNFATIIGEETYGRTSTYTSLVPIYLSIPSLKFGVAHRMVINSCSKGFNIGLKPDIVIPRTHASYLTGKDDVIEYILNSF